MSWRRKLRRNQRRGRPAIMRLRFEPLEPRQMLTSNVVNIFTHAAFFPAIPAAPDGALPAAGDIVLEGDGTDNSVIMTAGSSPSVQFLFTGGVNALSGATTQFAINGAAPVASWSLSGFQGNIWVDMTTGNDTFDFEGPAGTGLPATNIPGSLNIINSGVDSNIINNAGISGDLNVYKSAGTTGDTVLTMNQCQVNGYTWIGTAGGGVSEANTTLKNSLFLGTGIGPALTVDNTDGDHNFTAIEGTTKVMGTPGTPAVSITDGSGGTNNSLAGNSATNEVLVMGDVDVTAGANVSGSGVFERDDLLGCGGAGRRDRRLPPGRRHQGERASQPTGRRFEPRWCDDREGRPGREHLLLGVWFRHARRAVRR